MQSPHPPYQRFLARLKTYERIEPFPKSRDKAKLEGVERLVSALGHPERACRIVHVAGTNGKGLTSAMIARLLQDAGHTVGLYTSPHVLDVRERIVLNGRLVDEEAFARAGHAVLDVADRLREHIHFSYFDLLTVIGFVAFREAGVAWAVLETGLGGLSDATNITDKALAVITRIGLDHLHVLGDSLPGIATQKLGICRPGVPTVLGAQSAALTPWIEAELAARESPVLRATDIALEAEPGPPPAVRARWADGSVTVAPLATDDALPPDPRLACAANALVAAEALLGPPADDAAKLGRLRSVLAVRLPGRLELRREQRIAGAADPPLRTVVLDGGHNPEAMQALCAQLARWRIVDYTLLLSLQSDKLVEPLRLPLAELVAGAQRLLLLRPQTARAPSEADFRAFLSALPGGRRVPAPEVCDDADAALRAAAEAPERPLVVTGSFWMLGDVMRLLEPADPSPTPARGTPGTLPAAP